MKYWTGVGSRNAPDDIQELAKKIGYKLKSEGWILRSGNALGMDHAFWLGACRWYSLQGLEWEVHQRPEELYLPWDGYNGGKVNHHWGCFLNPERYPNFKEAMELVSGIHPNWAACKRGARAMHTRNVYQVLGRSLAYPSKFLICYAPPQGEGVKGGTNTAYMLAKMNDIPCFNLYVYADRERIVEWLQLEEEIDD